MNTLEKKYQIFISSTYKDLTRARDEVIKVILNMYHIPIGMEMFSADNEDQWDTIQETISSSDYYVLIIGHRYGSEAKEGISYTEKEFDYAIEMGVPVYTYIRHRDISTKPSERDQEAEKALKLDAFITKVQNHSMVEFWHEPSDLGQKVSIAITKAFKRRPRIGWVKADMAASPQTLEELASLSRENRELKDQIQKLQIISQKSPLIRALINGEEILEFKIPEKFDNKKLLKEASYKYPKELDPLAHSFYTVQNVDLYNMWFKSNPKIVDEYNQVIERFERSKAYAKKIEISLKNIGKVKANDINVTITFPDEVFIDNKNTGLMDIDWSIPKGIPNHPTKIAQDKSRIKPSSSKKKNYVESNPSFMVPSLNSSFKIENKTITIYLKNLLHTQEKLINVDDLIHVMPLRIGNFSANVQVICEEYSEPDEYELPITVLQMPKSILA